MIARHAHNGITWIDLQSPTPEEIANIAVEFDLNHDTAEELLLPSLKPRVDFTDNWVYLILHFPALRHGSKTKEQEVDFVVGQKFIITTHYDSVDPLHKFSKVFETNSILDREHLGEHAGFLLYYMLKNLYKAIDHEGESIRRELSQIEEHIFTGHEVEMVEQISRSARDLLNVRQTIEPHREVLHDLETNGAKFFGTEFVPYLKGMSNEYYRVHNHIMRNTESLHELRETNNSLLTTKQNETMRVLTVMALLTFPLALFVAISDFHGSGNPFAQSENGFWYLLGMVVTAATALLWWFSRKKWL